MNNKEIQFLKESNAIEGVFDEDSLQQAIYAWEYISAQKEITPHDVLKTHKILMLNHKLLPDEKGYFRHCKVYIGGKEGLEYKKISKAVVEWCYKMNLHYDMFETIDHPKDMEKLNKELHIQYETIHPFVDGNGRTGRMFMNWWNIKNKLPILVIKASERQDYYKWFK